MIGEIALYGVYLPAILVPMLMAFGLSTVVRMLLERLGFYRWVWHRSLFNVSLYVIVLGGVVMWSRSW
ncbi:MAG TPA: DUF1656 domain-containing protein [Aquabacterium sp.]|nr:DUF1656 domain-containing protein [Aquabacterium sp.]